MKKLLLMKTMLLLCALIVGSSSVWAVDVTFVAGTDKGQTSVTKGGITISMSTMSRDDNYRTYANTDMTVSSSVGNITSIVIMCTGSETSNYGPGKFSGDGYTYSGTTGTWIGSATSVTLNAGAQVRMTQIVVSYTPASTSEYDINLESVTNGSIVSDKSKAKAGETVTLTATPASGYATGTWTVTDESSNDIMVTKTGNNTATFSMPSSDVSVSATFLEIHTVTYYIGGVENNIERAHGSALALNDPEFGALEFAGWSSTRNATSPTFIANSVKVNADMTVYAIFVAKKGAASYQLVEADLTDWSGDYLIAYDDETFADGRKGGTDNGCIGKQSVSVDPGEKLSGKTVDGTWGDTYNVTLEAIDNTDLSKGYLLKTKDGKYNYQSSNSNGLAATDNKTTASAYPISVTFTSSSDVKLCLGGAAAGAVFRYNTSGYFRFYKDGGQKAVYVYKRNQVVDYTLAEPEAITVSSVGLATFASDVALDFTGVTDLEAYIAKEESGAIKLHQVNKVPAGTGVLLRAKNNATDFEVPLATTNDDVTGNLFVRGTGAAVATGSGPYNWILSKKGDVVGFYQANGNKVAKNRAYLQTSTASARISLDFDDNETTGLSEELRIKNEESAAAWYDLQGRKVANPTKGLYIVNGKKVVIK